MKRPRLRLRKILVPLVCMAVMAYFSWHALHGGHGLFAWMQLNDQLETANAELDKSRSKREYLERRVALMRPESLDPDMLDERSRATLNYAHPNDITIMIEPGSHAGQNGPVR